MDGFHIDYSKLNNLIIRKRIFIKEYPLEMLEAEKKIGRELKAALVEATSNTAYKQRHRPPYPYSPKVNTPPIPKELVNMQTGNLNKSWVARTIGTVNGITTSIYNTKNYSRFFDSHGTVKMIIRDVVGHVFKKSIPLQRETLYHSHFRKFRDLGGE